MISAGVLAMVIDIEPHVKARVEQLMGSRNTR
jgi:hypothetical protein